MRYLVFLLALLPPILIGVNISAQNSPAETEISAGSELAYGCRTGNFIEYCHQELFSKFERRRFGLTPLYGQASSFEFWTDSVSCRYLIMVDIAEKNWEINKQRSILLLYHKYSDDFIMEAYVEIFYRGMIKPILAKKYQIIINGKTSYQLLKSEPDYYRLYVPFKKRQDIETQALKTLAAKVSSDLFNIIN